MGQMNPLTPCDHDLSSLTSKVSAVEITRQCWETRRIYQRQEGWRFPVHFLSTGSRHDINLTFLLVFFPRCFRTWEIWEDVCYSHLKRSGGTNIQNPTAYCTGWKSVCRPYRLTPKFSRTLIFHGISFLLRRFFGRNKFWTNISFQ